MVILRTFELTFRTRRGLGAENYSSQIRSETFALGPLEQKFPSRACQILHISLIWRFQQERSLNVHKAERSVGAKKVLPGTRTPASEMQT